jgi:hypothetical protein
MERGVGGGTCQQQRKRPHEQCIPECIDDTSETRDAGPEDTCDARARCATERATRNRACERVDGVSSAARSEWV